MRGRTLSRSKDRSLRSSSEPFSRRVRPLTTSPEGSKEKGNPVGIKIRNETNTDEMKQWDR